jgi:hypothetical protein
VKDAGRADITWSAAAPMVAMANGDFMQILRHPLT